MTDPSPEPEDLLALSIAPIDIPDTETSLWLLAKAQRGDQAALQQLLHRYQDRLRRIVSIQLRASPLRRHYDSMDIVQNAFCAALPRIAEFQPRSAAALLRWFSEITLHQICDAYDLHTAAKRDMARQEPPPAGEAVTGPSQYEPVQQAQLAEVRALLDEEVARLPEDQRLVVLWKDYCGEEWAHIAVKLCRDVGAARQLHQRAWIRLCGVLRPLLEVKRRE